MSPSASYHIPKAPLIYINDPSINESIVTRLAQLIPKTVHVTLPEWSGVAIRPLLKKHDWESPDTIFIFSQSRLDSEASVKKSSARAIQDFATKNARNFASINLYTNETTQSIKFGTNHLDLLIDDMEKDPEAESRKKAEKLYQWLFTVWNVKDTLHLISNSQMQEIDASTAFRDYKYCAVGDCRKVSEDAKVQFVVLVVTKPAIVSKNRLVWQVADKTGAANFYFHWRGAASQPTWDWCLQLEPGQRKCLPRMPSVLIKESLMTAIVKAPIRIPGSIIHTTGQGIKMVGKGVSKIGKAMKMGSRKKWVLEEDVPEYLCNHKNVKVVPSKDKVIVKVFTEQGSKIWSDKDSDRSTLAGSDINEKGSL